MAKIVPTLLFIKRISSEGTIKFGIEFLLWLNDEREIGTILLLSYGTKIISHDITTCLFDINTLNS